MSAFLIVCGAINGLLSVALGAFAAHALKASLSASSLATFYTANEYHMAHSLVLLALGILMRSESSSALIKYSGFAFLAGILLFSGSLYVLSITGIKSLGMITPIGGVGFIVGWALLVAYGWKKPVTSGGMHGH